MRQAAGPIVHTAIVSVMTLTGTTINPMVNCTHVKLIRARRLHDDDDDDVTLLAQQRCLRQSVARQRTALTSEARTARMTPYEINPERGTQFETG